jgi:hypothetical protein
MPELIWAAAAVSVPFAFCALVAIALLQRREIDLYCCGWLIHFGKPPRNDSRQQSGK